MSYFQNNEESPDFSNPSFQEKFLQRIESTKDLLQREIEIVRVEQGLLHQRITLAKEFLNDLPSSDPEYSMLAIQIRADQIELDELKAREEVLSEELLQENDH